MKKRIFLLLVVQILTISACASNNTHSMSTGAKTTVAQENPVPGADNSENEIAITTASSGETNTGDENSATSTTPNETKTEDENKTGVELDGKRISWANMSIDNEELNLTDDQKIVLNYFDDDYFYVSGLSSSGYEQLLRYPKAYRNAQISFNGEVIKILSSDDETYTALFQLKNTFEDYDWIDFYPEDDENLVVIQGKQKNARLIAGDLLDIRGRYSDIVDIQIDGESYNIPKITVFNSNMAATNFETPPEIYSLEQIDEVSKIIFGNNIKVTSPNYDELWENYGNSALYSRHYVITPDNQSNANFKTFNIYSTRPLLTDGRDLHGFSDIRYDIRISPDFNHFIVFTYDENLNKAYIDYFDKDFNKIWGKEFNDVDSIPYDATINNFYLVADNDLYVLDTKTGEDKIASSYVGSKLQINLMDDGAVLVGEGTKDNVMKVSPEGDIIWKTSLKLDLVECDSMQLINDNIVLSVSEAYTDEDFYKEGLAVISNDGEIILETYNE